MNIVYILIFLNIAYIFAFRHEQILNYINDKVTHMKANNVIIPQEVFNQNNYDFDSVETTNDFEPKDISDLRKIYYTVLNNGWTSFTFYCPKEYETCLDDVEKLYTSEQILELQEFVDKAINDLNINIGNPTVDDIIKIHDFLIDKISYDTDFEKNNTEEISNNAYGAIKNGLALCSGYTDTFNIFLDKLNIPNFKVTTEKHVWTAIYFDNKWSHLDVTWDDPVTSNGVDMLMYDYYFIDTNTLITKDTTQHNFDRNIYREAQ